MATCEKSGPGYYASERYAPRYWLSLCEEARTGGEYEVAIGYAHLALLLCQHIGNTFHPKTSERLPQTYLDNSVWIQMSTYDHDPKNFAENETVLYFEGLKLIACQNIVADLLVLGFYAEAQAMTEYIITPTNWLVDVAEEERFRLAAALEEFGGSAMTKSPREQGKTYLRHNTKLWKNPFDIDTSTKEGVNRLANLIFHSRTAINPKQPLPSDQIRTSIGFIRHPRNDHKPCFVSQKKFQKKDVIWIDGTLLGVTSDQGGSCECCLVIHELHPDGPKKGSKPCCGYMHDRVSPSCWKKAKEWYHTHAGDTAESKKQDRTFYRVIGESKVEDFGHALPLIQRLIKLVKIASENERMHPLQYDIIPFLPSDCPRLVPWSYKRGIVDVINLLIMEGIDPFVEDFWNIRTILVLWRKFGPIDFHLIAQDETTTNDGEVVSNFSCIFPIYPFLMHSCEPNTRVSITPDAPTRLRLIAMKQIGPGEPITISRIQYDHMAKKAMSLTQRRQAFEALGVCPCQCELCTRELMETIQRKRKAPGTLVGDAKFKDADSQTHAKMLESRSKAIQAALEAMKQKYPPRAMTAEEKQRADRRTREEVALFEAINPPKQQEGSGAKEKDTPGGLTAEKGQRTDSSMAEGSLMSVMKRKKKSAADKEQRGDSSAVESTPMGAIKRKREKGADKGQQEESSADEGPLMSAVKRRRKKSADKEQQGESSVGDSPVIISAVKLKKKESTDKEVRGESSAEDRPLMSAVKRKRKKSADKEQQRESSPLMSAVKRRRKKSADKEQQGESDSPVIISAVKLKRNESIDKEVRGESSAEDRPLMSAVKRKRKKSADKEQQRESSAEDRPLMSAVKRKRERSADKEQQRESSPIMSAVKRRRKKSADKEQQGESDSPVITSAVNRKKKKSADKEQHGESDSPVIKSAVKRKKKKSTDKEQRRESSAEDSPLMSAVKRRKKGANNEQQGEPGAGETPLMSAMKRKKKDTADKGLRVEKRGRKAPSRSKAKKMVVDYDHMLNGVAAEYYRLRERSFEELTRKRRRSPGAKLPKPIGDMTTQELDATSAKKKKARSAQDTMPITQMSSGELEAAIQEPVPIQSQVTKHARVTKPISEMTTEEIEATIAKLQAPARELPARTTRDTRRSRGITKMTTGELEAAMEELVQTGGTQDSGRDESEAIVQKSVRKLQGGKRRIRRRSSDSSDSSLT